MIGDEAIAKQRAFEQAYMFAKPYDSYVNGCSLQTVGFLEELLHIRLGRHSQDLCLYVFLERPLPHGMQYPKEFDGLPVITRAFGEIREEEPIYEDKELDE